MEFAGISMSTFTQELLTSVVFVAILIGLRTLLIRMVRRNSEILSKEQRRWINRIKNSVIIVIFVCLALVWAPQLQTFALSLTAFAVALVVATKEMILCLTGSLFRISTQPYKVGDWITIDGVTGEVMEINAFNTRLEELDVSSKSYQFTGKSVMMPNSKLFTSTVENQNFIKSFIFHELSVAVQFGGMNPSELAGLLRDITQTHVAPFRDDAIKFARRVSRKAGIDLPEAKPSFGFRTTELGHFVFSSRIFVPTKRADDVGVAIIQDFLTQVHKMRTLAEQAAMRAAAQAAPDGAVKEWIPVERD